MRVGGTNRIPTSIQSASEGGKNYNLQFPMKYSSNHENMFVLVENHPHKIEIGGYTLPTCELGKKCPGNKIIIYNSNTMNAIGEVVLSRPICEVKIYRNRVIAVVDGAIYFYKPDDLKAVHKTVTNKFPGIPFSPYAIGVTDKNDCDVIAFLQPCFTGLVCVNSFSRPSLQPQLIETFKGTEFLSAIALDPLSKRLAASNANGTSIEVWEIPDFFNNGVNSPSLPPMSITGTGNITANSASASATIKKEEAKPIHVFYRGRNECKIQSLMFSPNGEQLLCSSDRGTIHIYSVKSSMSKMPDPYQEFKGDRKFESSTSSESKTPKPSTNSTSFLAPLPSGITTKTLAVPEPKNTISPLSVLGSWMMRDYQMTESSFCQIKLPDVGQHVATFATNNTIYVACKNGIFYTVKYLNDGTNSFTKCYF